MGHLWDALCRGYEVLGFEQATSSDEVFRQLALARIIEPASKPGSLRVLDLRRRFSDVTPAARSLVKRLLQRVGELARTYGIHRTTVSAHIARAGKARPRGRVAAETLDS
jgi:hypothetical protein